MSMANFSTSGLVDLKIAIIDKTKVALEYDKNKEHNQVRISSETRR